MTYISSPAPTFENPTQLVWSHPSSTKTFVLEGTQTHAAWFLSEVAEPTEHQPLVLAEMDEQQLIYWVHRVNERHGGGDVVNLMGYDARSTHSLTEDVGCIIYHADEYNRDPMMVVADGPRITQPTRCGFTGTDGWRATFEMFRQSISLVAPQQATPPTGDPEPMPHITYSYSHNESTPSDTHAQDLPRHLKRYDLGNLFELEKTECTLDNSGNVIVAEGPLRGWHVHAERPHV